MRGNASRAALAVAFAALVVSVSGIAAAMPSGPRAHAASRGPRGPRGFRGPRGPRGFTGPAGSFSTSNVIRVAGPTASMCADAGVGASCTVGASTATCPPGSVVLGGGFNGLTNPPVSATIAYDYASTSGSWEVVMANQASITASMQPVAECARGGGAAVDKAAVNTQFARDLAAARRAVRRAVRRGVK